jgi:hypothetical protein
MSWTLFEMIWDAVPPACVVLGVVLTIHKVLTTRPE